MNVMHKTVAGPAGSSVLVVDDDTELCQLLTLYCGRRLRRRPCTPARSAWSARSPASTRSSCLTSLPPDIKGFEVLRRVGPVPSMPVLMLTARGDEQDRILGLQMGADDLPAQAVQSAQLAARIEAVLRRSRPDPASLNRVPWRPWSWTTSRSIAARGRRAQREAIELTTVEFDLLVVLRSRPGA